MPHGHTGLRSARLDGVPFELTLTRKVHWATSDKHDGRLFVQRMAPENGEALRRTRIERALNKKIGQLAPCKERGAICILVLENNDIALTNHICVAEALEEIMPQYDVNELPDEIFLVDTTIDSSWTVWSLVRAGELLFDEYTEYEPSSLDEV